MTRIAVIADIHSNLQALEAVCRRIDTLNCQEIFCLGDIVGYGIEPSECLQIVENRNMVCVQGNHDAHVSEEGNGGAFGFNYGALQAVAHNRKKLSSDQLKFLKELPSTLTWDEKTMLVHGSPQDRDKYLRYDAEFRDVASHQMETYGPGIIFFGHTHVPMAYAGENTLRDSDGVYFINSDSAMLFNPGSVGQPRDGDPRAAFMIWDVDERTVRQHRAEYDVENVCRNIINAGLPSQLGDRLLRGR